MFPLTLLDPAGRMSTSSQGGSRPGSHTPNASRNTSRIGELLRSDSYQQSTSRLTIALGRTIEGEPYVTDLATLPHLPIAGAAGSDRTGCLHAILASLLHRAAPEDVRLIIIDPKRLALGM